MRRRTYRLPACLEPGRLHLGRLRAPAAHLSIRAPATSPQRVASATVVAPGAMLADALATAAFVLGPAQTASTFSIAWASKADRHARPWSATKRGVCAVRRRAKKFFKTPKGLLTLILALLAAIAAPGEGLRTVLPGLRARYSAAGLVDLCDPSRCKKKAWEFPSGAVLTAMIVAMVLRAQEPWYVVTITSVAPSSASTCSAPAPPTFSIPPRWRSSPASTCSTPAKAGGAR